MSCTLIIPCAGQSSRFNLAKPKWMLTHPNGNLMLIEAISGLLFSSGQLSKIVIIVNEQHIRESRINLGLIKEAIYAQKGIEPVFVILPQFTSSQAETVYLGIQAEKISGSIFIKDCDSYFSGFIRDENSICISSLGAETNPINKSYVSLNKLGELVGIVEKQVIGNLFSVGGYSFKEAGDFARVFEEISAMNGIDGKELYISHIIQKMLLGRERFTVQEVSGYKDWGTIKDWLKYTSEYRTLFIDLDGVLVQNSGEFFSPSWGETEGIGENIAEVQRLHDEGKTHIILTTSRSEKYRDKTAAQLARCNVPYHRILFDLPHCSRTLINDFADTNPYPTARAISITRDSSNLKDYL